MKSPLLLTLVFGLLAHHTSANIDTASYSQDEDFIRAATAGDFAEAWITTLHQRSTNQPPRFTIVLQTHNDPIEITDVYKLERSPDYQIEGKTIRGNLLIAIRRNGVRDVRHIIDPRRIISLYEQ